ncbi:WRKY transcription factor 28-like isoform X2 [Salvia miltiorrhiza]|uniref:WRKY transcription factor 28-like isoform X2 n=1 Tax=Salvia miltiorrhiza TaxID=226208 RepID=UPI0025ACD100|nr:WRKY transcription factor 28-like isoform X2 [Salvia miltiorrhiza]
MSNDPNKINPYYPFFEFDHDHVDHNHTMLSEGFAFPIVTDHNNFSPFMYQNPNEFHHILQGYNTLSPPLDPPPLCNNTSNNSNDVAGGSGGDGGGGENIPVTPNSSASISSQEAGAEEDSSKSKKDVRDGKSKNVKAKEKEGKKQRQARFAFMTKSEVDNLEDGYRWRKYGQKAVKNSPFPRCTSQKCNVKKRIERSYQDATVVITTYEGQHNHHSPAVLRGSAAAMLAPSLFSPQPAFPTFPQDMFYPSSATNFYTQLTDSGRHVPPPPPPPA